VITQIRETKCRDNFNVTKAYSDIESKGTTMPLSPNKDTRMHSMVADIAQVDALKRRKELIQQELEHIKGVLRHKQVCMRSGGTVKTLHPALAQTSHLDHPEVKLDHTRF
jgi:hypothetical protein